MAKPNGGLARARNVGQQVAFGEYVAWLDADDIAHPDRIAVQAAVLDREPTAALVCSDFSAFVTGLADIETSHIGTYYSSFAEREGAPGLFTESRWLHLAGPGTSARYQYWIGEQFQHLILGNFVHPPTLMTRRKWLEAVGSHDPGLRSGSDYEYILRLSRLGPIAFVDAPLLRYRRGNHQMSESFIRGEIWSEYRTILTKVSSPRTRLLRSSSR